MASRFHCVLALILVIVGAKIARAGTVYSITPEPEWATPLACTDPEVVPESELQNGVYYFLVDEFTRAEEQETFGHFARKVVNEAGVQHGSEIRIIVDPEYETLELHKVDVLRDGKWHPRLTPEIVTTLQRETQMDRFLLDGRHTVVIRLPDVRRGDVICYSFTRRGANPVMAGHFYHSFGLGSDEPREMIRQRIQSARPLHFRPHETSMTPKVTGDIREWRINDPEVIRAEESVPPWTTVYPWVEASDMSSWSDVVKWALPLYDFDQELPTELLGKVDEMARLPDARKKVEAALRLVQDEVRYFGVETGVNSHQPRTVREVFERRFGDCKEKVVLFGTVLAKLGISSAPVLVNTEEERGVKDFLPSPYAFNHVIAEVDLAGTKYFLDPTRSYQRGPIEQIYIPPYGWGLRVREGETALCAIEPRSESLGETRVRQTFHLGDIDNAHPSRMEIETEFTGSHAEEFRSSVASRGTGKVQADYLDFYAQDYSSIEVATPLEVKDDPVRNIVTAVEKYRIPQLWKDDGENSFKRVAQIAQPDLDDRITWPRKTVRKWPYALAWPMNFHLTTRVHPPDEDWGITREKIDIRNPWFDFSYVATPRGNGVEIEGHFQTLSREVKAAEIPRFREDAERAWNSVWYALTYDKRFAKDAVWVPASLMILAVIVVGVLSTIAAVVFSWQRRSQLPPPLPEEAHLSGLAGWLILVGIGVVLGPFVTTGALFQEMGFVFNQHAWSALLEGEIAGAALAIFAALGIVPIIVFQFALIPLFFLRRRQFPMMFVGTKILELGFVAVCGIGMQFLPQVDDAHLGGEFVRTLIGAAIWVPYMFVSRRVKATFRR